MFDGQSLVTGANGMATVVRDHNFAMHTVRLLDRSKVDAGSRSAFVRWVGQRDPAEAYSRTVTKLPMKRNFSITAAFDEQLAVVSTVVKSSGGVLAPDQVSRMTLKSDSGRLVNVPDEGPVWLEALRPAFNHGILAMQPVAYSLQSIIVDGADVVDGGKQTFQPATERDITFVAQFHTLTITAHDALFGSATSARAVVTFPNGTSRSLTFGHDHSVVIPDLPRGEYTVTVVAGHSVPSSEEFTLSKDKLVDTALISYLDLIVIVVVALVVAALLLQVGRKQWGRHLLARGLRPSQGRHALPIDIAPLEDILR